MSIASELSRLQQAKSDLATSIDNKGVTVPAATTLDGYAALVDQIQQGGLPYDAEIEYIESTGTQYIDTGITLVYATDIVEMSLNIAITSGSSRQLNGTNGYLFFGVNASQKFEIGAVASGTYDSDFHNWYLSTKVNRKVAGVIDSAAYYGASNVSSSNTSVYALYLFALGGTNGAAAALFIKQKLKNAVIRKNGAVVRDFIPVRVGQVGYLYDRVSGELFGNAGTGNFTLGADKS